MPAILADISPRLSLGSTKKKEKQKSRIAGYFNLLLEDDNRSALTFVLFRGRIETTISVPVSMRNEKKRNEKK
jgi:hypothetical protein